MLYCIVSSFFFLSVSELYQWYCMMLVQHRWPCLNYGLCTGNGSHIRVCSWKLNWVHWLHKNHGGSCKALTVNRKNSLSSPLSHVFFFLMRHEDFMFSVISSRNSSIGHKPLWIWRDDSGLMSTVGFGCFCLWQMFILRGVELGRGHLETFIP